MKRLIIALFALGALGVLASASFAADNTVWLCEGKEPTSKSCLVSSEGEGNLTLEDMKEEAAIECTGADVTDEGWVGPGSEDETTRVTFTSPTTNCKPTAKALNEEGKEVANKCESVVSPGVGPVDLGWVTLLELVAGKSKDRIKETTHGQPGYTVHCKSSILELADECKSASAAKDARVEVENLLGTATEPPLVTVTFPEETESKSEWAKCSLGGEESGLVRGKVLIAALNSSGTAVSLEVSEVTPSSDWEVENETINEGECAAEINCLYEILSPRAAQAIRIVNTALDVLIGKDWELERACEPVRLARGETCTAWVLLEPLEGRVNYAADLLIEAESEATGRRETAEVEILVE